MFITVRIHLILTYLATIAERVEFLHCAKNVKQYNIDAGRTKMWWSKAPHLLESISDQLRKGFDEGTIRPKLFYLNQKEFFSLVKKPSTFESKEEERLWNEGHEIIELLKDLDNSDNESD